jgi:hypothetical protein
MVALERVRLLTPMLVATGTSGVGVLVGVRVADGLGVRVGEGVGVRVGVRVAVGVKVGGGVEVGTLVLVAVGFCAASVAVGVRVAVADGLGVEVAAGVGVLVTCWALLTSSGIIARLATARTSRRQTSARRPSTEPRVPSAARACLDGMPVSLGWCRARGCCWG